MRPLLAIILAVSIILSVRAFISAHASAVVAPSQLIETSAEGEFVIELLLTFDAGPDPFALDLDAAPSLLLEQRNQTLLSRTDSISAGQTISVPAPDVVVGENEFYLKSTVADDDPDKIRAVRVRILRSGEVITKQWVESEPGMAVEGRVMIKVPASSASDVEAE